jgi:hypothetical protein
MFFSARATASSCRPASERIVRRRREKLRAQCIPITVSRYDGKTMREAADLMKTLDTARVWTSPPQKGSTL